MTFANDARGKLDDAQAQIEHLREQVEALMKDRVTPAIADFAGRAETAVNTAKGAVRHQADAVSGQVRVSTIGIELHAVPGGFRLGNVK